MISTKLRRHRDSISCHAPRARDLAALCAAQCSFWHALLQYSTLLHALHLLRPPLRQPGYAQRRRSLAPDAPALEPKEAALVVAQLSAEQTEDVTSCG
jgi:hypothetical protein